MASDVLLLWHPNEPPAFLISGIGQTMLPPKRILDDSLKHCLTTEIKQLLAAFARNCTVRTRNENSFHVVGCSDTACRCKCTVPVTQFALCTETT